MIMSVHRKRKPETRSASQPPPVPKNIGKRKKLFSIHGQLRHFRIEDEITRFQSGGKHKVIVFQKIRFEHNNRQEFRFGYYMLGVKQGMKGRWVWGQFCLMIPKKDLRALIREAKKRRWL
jgi:hypothetical protein